jgi:ATP-dependent Lon protease
VEPVDQSNDVASIQPQEEMKMDNALVEIRNPEKVALTDAAIMDIITHYCGHEAGVRNLKKCLDRVFRKIVAKIDMKESKEGEVDQAEAELEYQINTRNLEKFLDIPQSDDSFYTNINQE